LFNIFINDLPCIFDDTCNPVSLSSYHLNSLLYADDLVILSESEAGLQNSLNKINNYCNTWGLTVNTEKSKIMVFNLNKKDIPNFNIGNNIMEVVNEITYLGVTLNKSGSFEDTKCMLSKKGLKAIFKLKKQLDPLPNINCSLHLFNHLIKPILLYCSEVWAYSVFGERNHIKLDTSNLENLYNSRTSPIERILNKFAKMTLGVSTKTDNMGTYGELGIYPLYIDVVDRMLKYWTYIEHESPNELLKDAYQCSINLHNKGVPSWYSFARKLYTSFRRVNNTNQIPNITEIHEIKNNLKKRFRKYWKNRLHDDSKCTSMHGSKLRTYREFKTIFRQEPYLSDLKNPQTRKEMTKFRLSGHRLMVEVGRYTKIKLEDRKCPNCNLEEIEDENHFLLTCPLYMEQRNALLRKVKEITPNIENLDKKDQFVWIMSNDSKPVISAVADYLVSAMKKREISLTMAG
jgi:hypothetical protein